MVLRSGDVELNVRFYFGSKRRRDLDTMNKLILDALTGIVYADDHQVSELHLYRDYDPKKSRIELGVH
jgi:crossover junction endodeoxyribonuclease RusA